MLARDLGINYIPCYVPLIGIIMKKGDIVYYKGEKCKVTTVGYYRCNLLPISAEYLGDIATLPYIHYLIPITDVQKV